MPSSSSERITTKYTPYKAVLRCDIGHLHSDLGAISQVFERDDERESITPGGGRMYLSYFEIYAKDSTDTGNFSYLPSDIKRRIWEEVFNLKCLFLEHEKPEVVMNLVKHPFSVEKRCGLYKSYLEPSGYDVMHDSTTIWVMRKQ